MSLPLHRSPESPLPTCPPLLPPPATPRSPPPAARALPPQTKPILSFQLKPLRPQGRDQTPWHSTQGSRGLSLPPLLTPASPLPQPLSPCAYVPVNQIHHAFHPLCLDLCWALYLEAHSEVNCSVTYPLAPAGWAVAATPGACTSLLGAVACLLVRCEVLESSSCVSFICGPPCCHRHPRPSLGQWPSANV